MSDLGEKLCIHSRGHSFDPNFMKICQNVYLHQVKITFETGSHLVKSYVIRSYLRNHVNTMGGTVLI